MSNQLTLSIKTLQSSKWLLNLICGKSELNEEQVKVLLLSYRSYLLMARQGKLGDKYFEEADKIYKVLRAAGIPLKREHRA